MRVVVLSDLHGNFPILPDLHDEKVDLLLVAGDIAGGDHRTNAQYKSMSKFMQWVKDIAPKKCIITPGNHDYWDWNEVFKYKQNTGLITCLVDNHIDYQGLIVHGTPWSLPFMNWNWMKADDRLAPHWENIHEDTHILINHGPALGMCDMPLEMVRGGKRMVHMGSKTLLDELWQRNIPYVFTGHIHSACHDDVRLSQEHDTILSCVSLLDEEYKVKYKPKILEM